MSIIEVLMAMVVLAILSSAIFALTATVQQKVQDGLDEEAVMNAVKEEEESVGDTTESTEDVFVEDVLEEEQTQGDEYTEVPPPVYDDPAVEEVTWFDGGFFPVFAVAFAVVLAAISKKTYDWKLAFENKEYINRVAAEERVQQATKVYYDSQGVHAFILRVEKVLGDALSGKDKEYFSKVRICSKAFDSIDRSKVASIGRIENVYIPAVVDVVEEIANAPSKTIAASLMPYFHRSCDVLREAMEAELKAYQDRAVMNVESKLTAVEHFSALKHDTDENGEISLTM